MVGYAPTPADFQSAASTKLASSPIVGVDGLEPPNSMRADLQSAAIATMRYPNVCRSDRIRTYDPRHVRAML
jgi:hypothetical protein